VRSELPWWVPRLGMEGYSDFGQPGQPSSGGWRWSAWRLGGGRHSLLGAGRRKTDWNQVGGGQAQANVEDASCSSTCVTFRMRHFGSLLSRRFRPSVVRRRRLDASVCLGNYMNLVSGGGGATLDGALAGSRYGHGECR